MENLGKGIMAGFIATLFLSVLVALKALMAWMPEFDLIGAFATVLGGTRSLGWLAHFVIGVLIYGIAIALLAPATTASATLTGLGLAAIGWLLMMLLVMPAAGLGMFATAIGVVAPVLTLVMHLLFGVVLGWAYGKLTERAGGLRGEPHSSSRGV